MSVVENLAISKYVDIEAVDMRVVERWAICQSDAQFKTYLCWNKHTLVEALFFLQILHLAHLFRSAEPRAYEHVWPRLPRTPEDFRHFDMEETAA